MKYLKKFESINNIIEIKEFISDYLVELTDKGYHIGVEHLYDNRDYFFKLTNKGKIGIDWLDIKDIFIPFLTVLENNYNIGHVHFTKDRTKFSFNYKDLDSVKDDSYDVISIYISI